MSSAPLVSVLMPCYNAEATVAAALDSMLSQTLRDFEMLALDDGSTDGTLALLQAAACADPRVRVVASEHAGIVPGLVQLSAMARGEFLARMDADDTAHPARLEKQLALMRARPDVVLCGTLVRMTGRIAMGRRRYQDWINSLVSPEDIARELFVECPVAHPTFLMRRSAFEAVGGYEEHGWAEDYDLCMRFALAGKEMAKVPEVLLEWHDRPGRASMCEQRYSELNFRALKRHYLFRSWLRHAAPFYQWGAGEVGKRWLREWGDAKPAAVVDIHPRKVGTRIHGYRIIAPEDLPPPGTARIVVAVGARGARGDIRDYLKPRGYQELRDFRFVA